MKEISIEKYRKKIRKIFSSGLPVADALMDAVSYASTVKLVIKKNNYGKTKKR